MIRVRNGAKQFTASATPNIQCWVTTIGLPLVIIIVCSYCADKLPCTPTKVHPSDASVTTRLFVERKGSMVITMPSLKMRRAATCAIGRTRPLSPHANEHTFKCRQSFLH